MQWRDLSEIYYVPTLAWAPGSRSEQDTVPGSWKPSLGRGADQGGGWFRRPGGGAGMGETLILLGRGSKGKLPGVAVLQLGLDSSRGKCSWQKEQHGGDMEKRKREKRTEWLPSWSGSVGGAQG